MSGRCGCNPTHSSPITCVCTTFPSPCSHDAKKQTWLAQHTVSTRLLLCKCSSQQTTAMTLLLFYSCTFFFPLCLIMVFLASIYLSQIQPQTHLSYINLFSIQPNTLGVHRFWFEKKISLETPGLVCSRLGTLKATLWSFGELLFLKILHISSTLGFCSGWFPRY